MTTTLVRKKSSFILDIAKSLAPLLSATAKIRSKPEDIAAFSSDAWPVSVKRRQLGRVNTRPDVVISISDKKDVATILTWASHNGVPVTPWGLGSSVVGGPLPVAGGITLDLSPMDRILEINETNLVVRLEPGVHGGRLETELNARGYTLNHSPQSLHRSTVGGWVSTRATGQFSSKYGGIEDLCVSVEAVLSDGTVIATKECPRMSVGPDLKHTLIGAEGCLGVVTQVTLKMFPISEAKLLETVDFPSVEAGVMAMRIIMAKGLRPHLLRFYDVEEARYAMRDSAYISAMMFLGCEGQAKVAAAELEACLDICREQGGVARGRAAADAWMERRFDFSAIEAVLDRDTGIADTIEISHDWSGIMKTYHALKQRLSPLAAEVLGHFSHAYTNGISLYVILIGEAKAPETTEQELLNILDVAMQTALETGATVAHHHGTGLARTNYVGRSLGSSMAILERLKSSLDPSGIMNPGKLGLPYRAPHGAVQDKTNLGVA